MSLRPASTSSCLCTGPRFFDTGAGHGGGGAIDMVMHLFRVDFNLAAALLRDKGL